jgi:hypothetical protein
MMQPATLSSKLVAAASPTEPGKPLGSMYMIAVTSSAARRPHAASRGSKPEMSCSILGPSRSSTAISCVERNSTG